MNVTAVVLTIEVKLPNSNLIKVEQVLTQGSGTLAEVLQGGQSTYTLTLTHGKVLHPLKVGESVWVQGQENGTTFKLPGALQTVRASEPWTFEGKYGSTGP
jgi:hypothetical protein